MAITPHQASGLLEFMDEDVSEEWLCLHTEISFDDRTHTIIIKIDNINEQSYENLKWGTYNAVIRSFGMRYDVAEPVKCSR